MHNNFIYNPDVLRTNVVINSLDAPDGIDFWVDLPFVPRVNDSIVVKDFVDLKDFDEKTSELIKHSYFKVLTIEWCHDEMGLFQTIALLGFLDSIVDLNVYKIDKMMRKSRLAGSESSLTDMGLSGLS